MTLPVHGFAAAVFERLGGELVEVNTGEIKSTLEFNQESIEVKNLVRGKLVDVVGDALVIECSVPGGTKIIFINCWATTSVSGIKGPGLMKDCYFNDYSTRNTEK